MKFGDYKNFKMFLADQQIIEVNLRWECVAFVQWKAKYIGRALCFLNEINFIGYVIDGHCSLNMASFLLGL